MEMSVKVQYRNERLQTLRQTAGYSQSQLAKIAGISARVLQNYEQGARDLNGAKLETLLRLCLALKCKLSDIVTDDATAELLSKYEK